MTFLGKLFSRANSFRHHHENKVEQSSSGRTIDKEPIRRSRTDPNPSSDTEEESDDDERVVEPRPSTLRRGAVDLHHRRPETVDCDERGLRRSLSARAITPQQLLAARFSAASNSDNGMDGALWAYCKLDTKHRGRNCMVMEGSSRKNVQQVIIKTFSITRMTETRRDRRNRELELLDAAAAVPNVMRLICTAEDDENLYTILDACPGCTLIELMANNGGRITEALCLQQVARPVLQAIAGLHALGIVHRHLKPEHIVCGGRGGGSSKLVDFTDAACVRQKHCLNSRVGELQYMAPEVLTKPCAEDVFHKVLFNGMAEEELPQYDEKVDLWSLGVVLLEAMTGRQPFPADSVKEMILVQQSMLAEAASASSTSVAGAAAGAETTVAIPAFIARHALSPPAMDFLARMLREDPAQRPSAAELLEHPWLTAAPQ